MLEKNIMRNQRQYSLRKGDTEPALPSRGESSNDEIWNITRVGNPLKRHPKSVKKHGLDKPKELGRGATCAILTDVAGLRHVLENALVYYALIHEYHSLDSQYQNIKQTNTLIKQLMKEICSSMYRGDCTVDMATCKIHAHHHLAYSIERYGAPMNFEASLGERNLKWWAKLISSTARKCGETTFITQTASRISDQLLLQKLTRIVAHQQQEESMTAGALQLSDQKKADNRELAYTRRACHAVYHFNGQRLELCDLSGKRKEATQVGDYLPVPVRKLLHQAYSTTHITTIEIWKEVRFPNVEHGMPTYARAFHCYDAFGSFFDWVSISTGEAYFPAKLLLLFNVGDEMLAVVWKATSPKRRDEKEETNISAQWPLAMHAKNRLPKLEIVPTSSIDGPIMVHEKWSSTNHNGSNLPQQEDVPRNAIRMTDIFSITESYPRTSWFLNCIDNERWVEWEES
jgi:hypothetical protein